MYKGTTISKWAAVEELGRSGKPFTYADLRKKLRITQPTAQRYAERLCEKYGYWGVYERVPNAKGTRKVFALVFRRRRSR